jgi:hypothetical protein
MAQALSASLRRAGHRVTASTTIAGTVEALMRRGSLVDGILTSTPLDSALRDDVAAYSRRFAANARFVVLHEASSRLEDIELALALMVVAERPAAHTVWN